MSALGTFWMVLVSCVVLVMPVFVFIAALLAAQIVPGYMMFKLPIVIGITFLATRVVWQQVQA